MTGSNLSKSLIASAVGAALSLAGVLSAGEPGKLTREVWDNIPGYQLGAFTESVRYLQPADSATTFTGSEAPSNTGNSYAARIRGYITAPVTGSYTFWIASDDDSELYLSTNGSKFGRVRIASLAGSVYYKAWDVKPSQKSAAIPLVQGQKYYIEALHKEGSGNDHLAIAWQVPGGARGLIPATALESFTADADDQDDDGMPDYWETAHGFSTSDNGAQMAWQGPLADPDHDGVINYDEAQDDTDPCSTDGGAGFLLLETWNNIPGNTVRDLSWNPRFGGLPDITEYISSAATPANRANDFGARMRGYVIAPSDGDYTFYISGDDRCELWLAEDGDQFHVHKAAFVDAATSSQQWTKYPTTQGSAPIHLVAGQKVYIEAIQKESSSSDHMELGWLTPGAGSISLIPGTALVGPAYQPNDPDGDGMPSDWEALHGLEPAINDAAGDPDRDGLTNHAEWMQNLDPQEPDSVSGGLLHELWTGVPGYGVKGLVSSPRFLALPDLTTIVTSARTYSQPYDQFGSRLRGYLTAPATGTYTFWVMGDDETELWLSSSGSKYDKQLLARPTLNTSGFDTDISQKSRPVTLVAGQRYYIEVLHKDNYGGDFCQIAWTRPGGTREIIPGAVLNPFVPVASDRDDDDLPDDWETANGLSPNDNGHINPKNGSHGDLDGDGLDNAAELKAGTRADLADTDGDGVNDRDEVEMLETSALTADAAPFESIATIPGASFTATSGSWIQESGKARQDCVRGWLEYPVALAVAGVYQLDLAFTPVTDAGVSPDYEIVFSADGKTIQRETVTVAEATSGHAKVLSPWLAAGSHTLRVFIDNSYHFRRVTVDQLEILAARGSDSNANDRPDWIDLRLAKYNSIEAPAESLTSPVCLEGKAKWSELTTIAGATVQPAPNGRWYADVPLDATEATEVIASLENGGLTATRQITWLPTNLLTTGTLSIRMGDSLKLSAFTGTTGIPEETVTLTVEGQTTTITADQPLVHTFTTAGSVPVQVTHSRDGNLTTATATIKVVAAPVIENPVCVLGYYREVSIPALPNGVSLQLDNRIDIRGSTTYPTGSQLHILRLNTLEDRPSVFRLGGTTGPIMGILPLRAMRVRDAGQTANFFSAALGNDTWDVIMPVVVDGNYQGTSITYDIFIGGVVFDDGSITRTLLPGFHSEFQWSALLHFYKAGTSGSNCHRTSVWQGNLRISFTQ